MSWDELLGRFRDRLLTTRRSPRTVRIYLDILADFAGFSQVEPVAVLPAHVEAFRQRLLTVPGPRKGRLYSDSSRYRMLSVLGIFFRWATERQLVLLDPTRDLELDPKPATPPLRRLTPEQVLAVLEAPDLSTPLGLRDRALLATFYATGIRRRECHMLDLADYDRTDQSLAVRHGKGGSDRKLPVLPHLAEMLEDYLDLGRPFLRTRRGERALFIASQTGRRLCYNQIWNLVTDYGKAVGVELTVHSLRHAIATHLLAGGAQLEHVKQLLGHARLESTQRYTAVSTEDIAGTHRRSHPRGRRTRHRPFESKSP